jgi:site-specific DNA recombinase
VTLRVAIYARVSTQQQTHIQTIEQQLESLHAYDQQQGWQLRDEHIFRDDGRSGADLNCPGLDRLRDAVRAGELDRVLVTEPDRLARNYVHQMVVLDELERFGCQVVFLVRPMSDDPHDRLLLQIRGAVAEYELTLIADRMRRGRQMKYRAGTLLPWLRLPYGYRLHPDRPRDPSGLTIDETEAAIIREVYAWYVETIPASIVWRSNCKHRGCRRPRANSSGACVHCGQSCAKPPTPARSTPNASGHARRASAAQRPTCSGARTTV